MKRNGFENVVLMVFVVNISQASKLILNLCFSNLNKPLQFNLQVASSNVPINMSLQHNSMLVSKGAFNDTFKVPCLTNDPVRTDFLAIYSSPD